LTQFTIHTTMELTLKCDRLDKPKPSELTMRGLSVGM